MGDPGMFAFITLCGWCLALAGIIHGEYGLAIIGAVIALLCGAEFNYLVKP